MSDFEARRQQTAIRCGHVVTTRNGSSFEVVDTGARNVVLQVGPDLLDTAYVARQSVTLNPDQLTETDEQRLTDYEKTRREEFAKTLLPLLRTYTFDRVRVHEGNQAAFKACRRLEYGATLFIHGSAGNGKTMLAVATAHHFAPYYSVEVWGAVNLFSAIRASFNPHSRVGRPNLERPELLVLDDIGKSKASDFVYEELYGLINHRLEHGKTTVFTSNHSVGETALKVSPDPDNLAAMVSRLASGTVVEVTGRDQRVLQGQGKKLG